MMFESVRQMLTLKELGGARRVIFASSSPNLRIISDNERLK